MEIGYGQLLDIALNGPEVGPTNLSILHGLLKQLFLHLEISNKQLEIKKESPHLGQSFEFIKRKFDESSTRPHTPRETLNRERSRISVIVTDYFRNPVGEEKPAIEKQNNNDFEDRLRYVESQLKVTKSFPPVEELKEWASGKNNADTLVTDLWHFVNLNHRMDAVEEGVKKLSKLVDDLIPELKMIGTKQKDISKQTDHLKNDFTALSDKTNAIDDQINDGVKKAEERLKELLENEEKLSKDIGKAATKEELEGYIPIEVFNQTQQKAKDFVEKIEKDLEENRKAEDLDQLTQWVTDLRQQMESVPSKDDLQHLDLYVKWPQLDEALGPLPKKMDQRERSCSRQACVSPPPPSMEHSRKFPTENCLRKLKNLAECSQRQNEFENQINKLQATLEEKANRDELNKYVTNEDLQQLLSMVKDLRQEVNDLENWKETTDNDDQLASLEDALENLQAKTTELTNLVNESDDKGNNVRKQIDHLSTVVDRLDKNKLDKDDDSLNEFVKKSNKTEHLPPLNPADSIHKNNYAQVMRSYSPDELKQAERSSASNSRNSARSSRSKTATPKQREGSQSGLNSGSKNGRNSRNDAVNESADEIESRDEFKDIDDLGSRDRGDSRNAIESRNVRDGIDDRNGGNRDGLGGRDGKDGMNRNGRISRDGMDSRDGRGSRNGSVKSENPWEALENESLHSERGVQSSRNENMDKAGRADLLSRDSGIASKADFIRKDEFQDTLHALNDEIANLLTRLNLHEETCNSNLSVIMHEMSEKMDQDNLKPLQKYIDELCKQFEDLPDDAIKPKNAALVRKQLKFNCLSCDRPLNLNNNQLQSVRGRPYNPQDLDQLRLLQKMLHGEKPHKRSRSCGGKYTKSPNVNVKINATMPMVYNDDSLIDKEIDIEGLDGRLYRGLVSRKDLHGRSKSEYGGDVRTITRNSMGRPDTTYSAM